MTALSDIAQFVAAAPVPDAAIAIARNAFLDTVGVTLAGAREPAAIIVQEMVATEKSAPQCHVLGTPLAASASLAALANGTAAHALDFDDMCFVSLAHPSAPLVSAALALGDQTSASGRALLEAYVIGFEMETAVGKLMNPRHYERGWHCTSTLGTLGAAAAAARILRLDAQATAHCLAIAASESSGLKENFGTMTKPLHAGLAARNGILAAQLAKSGFTASERALDGPQGFLVAMQGQHSELTAMRESLGRRWEILETGITVKLYPSCAATHPALDTVLDIRREHQLSPSGIESVTVEVDSITPGLLIYDRPQTGLEGKFSMPFCISATLVHGQVGLETFEVACIRDMKIQEMLPRVKMEVNPGLGKHAPALTQAIVTIALRDGRVLRCEANGARGYPERPASDQELKTKFLSCGRRALPEETLRTALEILQTLETAPNISRLMELLAAPHPALLAESR